MALDIYVKYNFKIIIGFFILLYAIITLLFFNFYKELAIKDTKQEAISILNTMKSIRNYVDEIQRPVFNNLKNDPMEEYVFDSRVLSASAITQYIYDQQVAKKDLNYEYKLVATNPLNSFHKANAFEADILNRFRREEIQDYFSMIEENNHSYFFIAMPIEKNKKSCLECHGNPQNAPFGLIQQYGTSSGFYEKVGDIRAMIYLKIAITSILSYHKEEFITGGIAMFVVFIIFIILIYVIYKKDKRIREEQDNLFVHQNRLAVMGSMIGNISHQWKQPLSELSYILINLELLSERNKLTHTKITNKVEEANQQISFMSNTINDFKNFFSPKKVHSEHSIKKILEHSYGLVEATFEKNSIKLLIEQEIDFVFYGSESEIMQVFINILNNAKDVFISNNTPLREIYIKTFKEKNYNVITIENNGGRIDDKIIDKIFEPYYSTKKLDQGDGIGLYICKVVVENYNGTIDVKNSQEGVIFTIKF